MRHIFSSIFAVETSKKIMLPSQNDALMRALEPRVLLDAAAAETSSDLADAAILEQQASDYIGRDDSHDALDTAIDALDADAMAPPLERGENRRNEVVFIDSAVDDLVYLLDNIREDVDVVILENSSDGLEQIAAALEGMEDVDAIHILSHGDVGSLQLGSTILSSENMSSEYADEMAAIRNVLTQDGDILIYGCNFGQGEEGLAAAEQLSELTGADIAASDDLTGAESLNGDWDLELQAGDVEADVVVSELGQEAFRSTLNTSGSVSNSAPSEVTGAEDSVITFSGANKLSVANTDGGNMTVELSVPQGDLTLSQTTGLTFEVGDGVNDSALKFSGSIADVNAALDGLQYTPASDEQAVSGDLAIDFKATGTQDNNQLQDGSFEAFDVPSGRFRGVPEADVPGWNTSSAFGLIEIWDHLSLGGNVIEPFEGDNLVELNYLTPDTLSQEFTATSNDDLTLSFAHRGRSGTEAIEVRLIDLGADGVLGGGDDTELFNKGYSTAQAWVEYTETITGITDGSNLLLEIESKHPGGAGNLVDAINIRTAGSPKTSDVTVEENIGVVLTPVVDAVDNSITVNENGVLTFDPMDDTNGAGADSFESDTASVTAITSPSNGIATLGSDGRITYTPNANFVGTDTFDYTVTSAGTTETATIEVTVVEKPSVQEDSSFTVSSANLTSEADYAGLEITELNLPAGASLTLDGVAVTLNQGITKADIDAGKLVFTPAPDQSGDDYFDFSYRVIPNVTVAEGHTTNFNIEDSDATTQNQSQTNIRIRDNNNFGPGGTVSNDFVFKNEANTIDSAYLQDVDVLFDGHVAASSYSATERTDIENWVRDGGVLISNNDRTTFDGISSHFGLPNVGRADNGNYTIASGITDPEALKILNGVFGQVSGSIPNHSTASYFSSDDLTSDDIVLAYSNGDTDRPAIVLRKVGLGYVLFTADVGMFGATGAGNEADEFNTPKERFIGNVFAWASERTAESDIDSKFCLDVTPVADAVDNSITVNENGALTFNPLEATNGGGADSFESTAASVTAVGTPSNGTASIASDGRVIYTPNADFVGTDQFTYTVTSGGATETATINVTVVEKLSIAEDETHTFTSANLTTETTYTGIEITELNVPTGATLQLNGIAVTVGQVITQADIDAGNLVFTPAPDQSGDNYFDLKYDVVPFVTLAEGHTSTFNIDNSDTAGEQLSQTNIRIRSDANFGANGIVPYDFEFVNEENTIDSAYLAGVDILFDGYVSQTAYSAAEQADIRAWVEDGGVLISTNDNSSFDAISSSFGLPIIGNASNTWTIAPAPSPASADYDAIINGVFGSVGTSITGVTGDYFNASDLQEGDIPLAYSAGNTDRVTMVLRPVGTGYVLFTGDEGVFRGGGASNTSDDFSGTGQNNERFIANVFAWAAERSVRDNISGEFCLDVTPVVDIVDDAIAVQEDGSQTFNPLENDSFENSSATVSSIGTPTNGSAVLNPDGTVTYTPNAGFSGTDTFDYTVTSGDATETATIVVTVEANLETPENVPLTLISDNFTDNSGYISITITGLDELAGGNLTLNGVDVVEGQVISKADIDAGLLVFTPGPNQNGENHLCVDYSVNVSQNVTALGGVNGIAGATIRNSGSTNEYYADINRRLLSNDVFGSNGPSSFDYSIVNPTTGDLNQAYLDQGQVLFEGFVPDGAYTNVDSGEVELIADWVSQGNVLISVNENNQYDAVPAHFGLTAPFNDVGHSMTYATLDPSSPAYGILNGPFGTVSGSTNTTFGYYTGTINPDDVILGTVTVDGEERPAMIARPHGDGWAVFSADVSFFREANNNPTINDEDDDPEAILIGNLFDWAARQAVGETETGSLKVDVIPVVETEHDCLGIISGKPVTINVLENDPDKANFDLTTLKLTGALDGPGEMLSTDGKSLTVTGEGTWAVQADGTIKFTPVTGFSGDPTPVQYVISDNDGDESQPTTVTLVAHGDEGATNEDAILTVGAPGLLGNDADTVDDALVGYNDFQNSVSGTTLSGAPNNHDVTLSGVSVNTSPTTNFKGISDSLVFDGSATASAASLENYAGGDLTQNDASFDVAFKYDPATLTTGAVLFETGATSDGISIVLSNSSGGATGTIDHIQVKINDNPGSATTGGTVVELRTSLADILGSANIADEFIQVSVVYDKDATGTTDTVKLYVNGVEYDSASVTGLDDFAGPNPTGIGSVNDVTNVNGFGNFIGEIASVNIHDQALTQEQIQASYNALVGHEIIASDTTSENGAVVVINDDGSYSYDPTNAETLQKLQVGESIIDTFTYTTKNAEGKTIINMVEITVDGVNDAPTSSDNTASTAEGTAVSGELEFTDIDTNNNFSYSVETNPTHGSVTVAANGMYTYTPTGDYYGDDSFIIKVNDGFGGTADIRVDVTVTPVQDTVADSFAVEEEGTLIIDAFANDHFENSSASITTFTTPSNGTLTQGADGKFTYIPNTNFVGEDSFTYTVTSDGVTETETVTITVTNTNDAAMITGDQAETVTEDGTTSATGNLSATDVDGTSEENFQAQTDEAGTYGTFSITTDGGWTYNLNNDAANVQALEAGQSVTDVFTVKSTDGTEAMVTITVNGANDAPTITIASGDGTTAASLEENGTLTASDTITVNDVDLLDTVEASITGVVSSGDAGTLTNDALKAMLTITAGEILDGTETSDQLTWSFDAGTEAFDYLAADETLQLTYTIEVEDDTGATATQDIVVTITGKNDEPTISATVATSLDTTEDTAVSGTVSATDADSDSLTYSVSSAPTNGTVTINETTGAYTYTPTADYNGTDTFTVQVSDGQGGTDTVTITTNIAAIADGETDTIAVVEETAKTFNVLDNDTFENSNASITSFTPPSKGTLTQGDDGEFTYTPNTNEVGADSFTYTVTSGGVTETITVNLNISNTNDAAMITGDQAETVTEDGTTSATGNLSATDVDGTSEENFQAQTDEAGTYGTFSITTDGGWTYNLNNDAANVQALEAGQSVTDVFTVKSTDGTEAMVTITVNGANDAPTITIASGDGTTAASLEENGTLTASDTITVNDVDLLDTVEASITGVVSSGDAGTLTNDALKAMLTITAGEILDGTETSDQLTWSFDAGTEAFDYLAADETLQLTYTIEVEDDTGATATQDIVVTITGKNDEPTISATVATSLDTTEDTAVSGTVSATDADSDSLTYSVSSAPTNGTVTINETTGAYTYTPTADYNGTDTFTVQVSDGQGGTDTVTITTNIAAIADGETDTIAVVEETAKTFNVLDNDTFENSNASITSFTPPSKGTLTQGDDGEFTYTPNTNEVGADSFTYTVTSGGVTETITVNLNISNTNDAAMITGDQAETVTEDGTTSATGNLSATDVDGTSEENFQAQTDEAGTYGTFSITTDGGWTYNLNNDAANVQALEAGQSVTDVFTVKSTDGTEAMVTITVNGANDAPTITIASGDGTTAASLEENGTLTASDTITVNDIDLLDTVEASITGVVSSGDAGTLTNDALKAMLTITAGEILDGTETSDQLTWSFDAGTEAFDYLAADETLQLTYTIEVEDDTGATATQDIVVTITGKNDKPTISATVATSLDTTEDTAVSGTVSATDADSDSLTYSVSSAPTNGTVTINETTGAYTYTPTADYNGTDTFTVQVSDGQGGTDTVTITTNIAAITDGETDTIAVVEETAKTFNVLDNDTFENSNASITSFTPPSKGTLTQGDDGEFTYTPNTNEVGADSFTYTVTSGGVTETITVNLNITNTNDAAMITGDQAETVTEDGTTSATGNLSATDVDGTSEENFQAQTDEAGTYGTFSITTDGGWTYNLNNDAANVQALEAGQSVTDVFTVKSTDGTEAMVTITVNGANDAPTITIASGDGTTAASLEENGTLTASDTITVNDVDLLDTVEASITGVVSSGDAGTLTNDALKAMLTITAGEILDGTETSDQLTWSFDAGTEAFDYLAADETLQLTYTIEVEDDTGATATQDIVVTITGKNDEPTISATVATSLDTTEDTAVSGTVSATDADSDSLTYSVSSAPTNGTVTINETTGAYTYTPTADYNGTDTFTVQVSDGQGGTDTVTITTNIAAIADGETDTIAVVEETAKTFNVLDNDTFENSNASITSFTPPSKGTLTQGDDGEFTYTPNTNEVGADSFTYTVTSGGVTETITVNLNISNTNDAAMITGDQAETVTEDGTTSATGNLSAEDVDGTSEENFQAQTDEAGTYGTFSITTDGGWTYNLNNDAANVQALEAGQSVTDVFTVKSTDGTEAMVTITVNGANDAPTITIASGDGTTAASLEENGTLTASDTITVNDVDLLDTVEASITGVVSSGDAGTLTNDALKAMLTITAGEILDGTETSDQLTWSFDAGTEAFDYLAADETLQLTYTIEVEDDTGATATQDIVVTITGKNDEPTISATVATSLDTTEDTAVSGTVSATDADSDSLTYSVSSAPTNGTVTINETTGAYTYTPTADYNGTDTFTVQVSDGQGGTDTVTITTNIAAIADGETDTIAVVEETAKTFNVLDNDTFENSNASITSFTPPSKGTLTQGDDGEFTYTPNTNEVGADSFTYTVTSGGVTETITVNLNISNTNDAAMITGDQAETVTEDGTTSATGNLSAEDVDGTSEENFQAQTDEAGTYGTFSITTDGGWTYNLNNDAANVQALEAGQSVTDVFTVKSTDGTEAMVTITVNGANDAPTITIASGDGTTAASLEENGTLTASDTITVNDVDLLDTVEASITGVVSSGDAGTLTNDALKAMLTITAGEILDGTETSDQLTWSFDAGTEAFDYLAADETLQLTYTIEVEDDTGATATQDIVVTITGKNDEPTISATVATSLDTTEDTAVSGTVSATDADSDSLTYSVSSAPTNGTVTINETTGAYTYTPTADYNGTDTFTVQVSDGQGGTDTVTITTNIAAIADGETDTIAVVEETAKTFNVLDNDTFENSNASITSFTPPSKGTLTQGDDGEFTYTPNTNEVGADSFTYTVTSGGVTETITVNLNISNTNDAAMITGDQAETVTEDGTTSATGNLSAEDVDGTSEENFQAQTDEAGTYGTFSITTDGGWTYNLNNDAANVQALEAGQSVTDVFTVKSTDGTEAMVTITVNGANDAPTITIASGDGTTAASLEENGTLTASDTITVNDVDLLDTVEASITGVVSSGDAGTLTNDALKAMLTITAGEILDGTETSDQLTWSFDAGTEAFDYLAADETLQLTYTIEVEDDTGATATQDIVVTITGKNDEPTISATVATSLDTTEDTAVSGTVSATDADSDSLTYSVSSAPTNGTVTINETTGAYTYTPTADYNGTDTFTVQVSDGQGGTDTVTITTNIAAIADGETDTIAVVEETAKTFNVLDNDTFENSNASITSFTPPSKGTLTQGDDGEFTYTPNTNEVGADSFTYTVTSGGVTETITVNLNISNTNDAAMITGDQAETVTEDGTTSATGNLSAEDVDGTSEENFQAQTDEAGTYGTFSITTDGGWTYNLNNDAANVQALEAGQSVTDVFTVKSTDGTEAMVTITVNGANDAPTITIASGDGTTAASLEENGTLTASDTITVNDVDLLDTVEASITGVVSSGDAGTLTNDALKAMLTITAGEILDGTETSDQLTWSFDAGTEAFDYLAADETLQLTYTIEVEDDTGATATQDIVVTITGKNDEPTISATVATSLDTTEDTAVSGTVSATDADSDSLTYSVSSAPTNGTVTINETTGAYTYTPTADYNGTDTFTVQVSDGQGGTDTVTITTNIAAIADGETDTIAVTEDQPKTFNVLDNDTFENSDREVTGFTDPSHGTLVQGDDGEFTYTPDANYNGSDSFTYTVTSGGVTETVTVDLIVAAVNDAAQITGDKTGSVNEDGVLTDTGKLNVSDIDAGEDNFQAQENVAGTYGVFSINADGEWEYELNNDAANVQALKANEEVSDVFIVKALDGTEATVTLTITGTNDAPIITVASGDGTSADLTENGTLNASDTLTVGDVDVKDVVIASIENLTIDGDQGDLSDDDLEAMLALTSNEILDATETSDQLTWNFDADVMTFDHLAEGEVLTLTYQIKVVDSSNAEAFENVVIKITGVNDAPTISPSVDTTPAVVEDGILTDTIVVDDRDDDVITYSVSVEASHGQVSVDPATGEYTYVPKADYNGTDSFVIKVDDNKGGTRDVTINVTVAADVDIDDDTVVTNEDVAANIDVLVNDTFEDPNASVSVTTAPSNGTLTPDGNGKFIYQPNENYHGTDSFTYTVTTLDGITETATVNISVNSIADQAVITGDATGEVAEDGQLTANDKLTVVDGDAGESFFTPQTDILGDYGKFSVDENGNWHYNLDNESDDVQALKADQQVTDSFTVTTADGTEARVVITISGANDAPTITINVGDKNNAELTENGTLTASETLTVTDIDLQDVVIAEVDGLTITGDQGGLSQNALEGMFDITPNDVVLSNATVGSLEWTFDAGSEVFDHLAQGEQLTLTYKIKVTDAQGESAFENVTIIINGINDNPELADGVNLNPTTIEDVVLEGSITGVDVDQDVLQYSVNTNAEHGAVTIDSETGEYIYTANPDYNGNDSFVITIDDQMGGTKNVIVNVTISSDIDIANDSYTTAEDVPIIIDVLENDTFEDSNSTLEISMQPNNGTITINEDGLHTYTPNPHFHGTDTITYSVTNSDGVVETATVNFVVTSVPDAAQISGNNRGETVEDVTVTASGKLDITDNDSGESFFQAQNNTQGTYGKFSIDADGNWGFVLDNASDAVQSLSAAEQISEAFVVLAADGTETNVIITIMGVNDTPTIADGSDLTPTSIEDSAVTGKIIGADVDNNAQLAYSLLTNAEHGTVAIDPQTGEYTYTPKADYNGNDAFTIKVVDEHGADTDVVVNVNVEPVVDGVLDTIVLQEDTRATFDVLVNDTFEDDNRQIVSFTEPQFGQLLRGSGGQFTYIPNPDYNGNDSFTYVVETVDGVRETVQVNLVIDDVPEPAPELPETGESTDGTDGTDGADGVASNNNDIPIAGEPLGVFDQTNPDFEADTVLLDALNGLQNLNRNDALFDNQQLTNTENSSSTVFANNYGVEGATGYLISLDLEDFSSDTLVSEGFLDVDGDIIAEEENGQNLRLVVETLIRQKILYVNYFNDGELEEVAKVVKTEVASLDGSELPSWIKLAKEGFIIVERPVGLGEIGLRITTIMESGEEVIRNIFVDGRTGEISSVPSDSNIDVASFSQRLRQL